MVAAVGIGIVAFAISGITPLVTAAPAGALVLVVGCAVTPGKAHRSKDLDVVVTIAAAINVSGLGNRLAEAVFDMAAMFGQVAILSAIVLVTIILREFITNKGSFLLLTPIAFSVAAENGGNPRGYAIAVAVASALAFLTPVGYHTNTMIDGPGGYWFADYLRLGLPLTAISIVGIIAIVLRRWPL